MKHGEMTSSFVQYDMVHAQFILVYIIVPNSHPVSMVVSMVVVFHSFC